MLLGSAAVHAGRLVHPSRSKADCSYFTAITIIKLITITSTITIIIPLHSSSSSSHYYYYNYYCHHYTTENPFYWRVAAYRGQALTGVILFPENIRGSCVVDLFNMSVFLFASPEIASLQTNSASQ